MWRHKERWMEGGGTGGKGTEGGNGETLHRGMGTKVDEDVEDEKGQWVEGGIMGMDERDYRHL